ncbi:mandelate racemase/muconate lactonizing enzyme family protein [Nocardia jiangxiensis]|uniref:mandelate racemase/muconate lactonizing enzyme family protein n=1 Tax=Nocardia jiangxiensis TaxID=282685 RepID=UPI000302493F|nr:enolase C-terminal domain-like protein [Nocardia jiangxiensis]
MRIDSVRVTPFVIPLVRPVVWATGSMTVVDWLLVEVVGEDGTTGIAEAIPRPMIYGETQRSIHTALTEYLVPLVVGEDSFALERIHRRMAALAGNFAAKSALDIALHDLNGKLTGLPIHALLGGPVRTEVDCAWMIALDDRDSMLAELEQKIGEGFRAFKVKGGLDPEGDIALLTAMRERSGSDVRLYLDANCRYDRDAAHRVMHALRDVLDQIEEPIDAGDDEGRVELARAVPTVPLLGDETVFTVADVARQIRLGGLRRISLKMPRTGYTLSRRIVHLSEAAGLRLQVSTQSETTLGTAGCLHLAASFHAVGLPCELTFYRDVADGLLTAEPTVRAGRMAVPTGPGLGVQLDPDKVAKYAVPL